MCGVVAAPAQNSNQNKTLLIQHFVCPVHTIYPGCWMQQLSSDISPFVNMKLSFHLGQQNWLTDAPSFKHVEGLTFCHSDASLKLLLLKPWALLIVR